MIRYNKDYGIKVPGQVTSSGTVIKRGRRVLGKVTPSVTYCISMKV
jgi:hypothetical protein